MGLLSFSEGGGGITPSLGEGQKMMVTVNLPLWRGGGGKRLKNDGNNVLTFAGDGEGGGKREKIMVTVYLPSLGW